jgi:hypothetical protein
MTAYKVKVNVDGSINLWEQHDSGWRDAIELTPKPTVASNQIAFPQYNLSTTPVEITYTIVDISTDERKSSEIALIRQKCLIQISTITQSWLYTTDPFSIITQLEQVKADLTAKIEEINSTTTHEELDAVLGL